MENQERKILVEVSQKEYEKIKAGALEENIPTYEDVRKDVLENLSADDVKIILSNHRDLVLDNIDNAALIYQIYERSQNKTSVTVVKNVASLKEHMTISGSLKLTDDDTFEWRLRSTPKDATDLK